MNNAIIEDIKTNVFETVKKCSEKSFKTFVKEVRNAFALDSYEIELLALDAGIRLYDGACTNYCTAEKLQQYFEYDEMAILNLLYDKYLKDSYHFIKNLRVIYIKEDINSNTELHKLGIDVFGKEEYLRILFKIYESINVGLPPMYLVLKDRYNPAVKRKTLLLNITDYISDRTGAFEIIRWGLLVSAVFIALVCKIVES